MRQVSRLQAARATAGAPTPIVTKVAYYVPPPTLTPSVTPTPTATPTNTSTRTLTLTPTPRPTRTVTRTQTPPAPRASPAARAAAPAATKTPTLVAPSPTSPGSVPGETFGTLEVISPLGSRAADLVADLSLDVRGFAAASATLALVDYTGAADGGAPQLYGLFEDGRTPVFAGAFQVYDWNWSCNCRGSLIADPEVTLVGMVTTAGEVLHVPVAGSEIGMGFQALVLYADSDQVTLKYTRSDGVSDGYTLQLEGVAVDPRLLGLYQQRNSAGRGTLPALRARQAFGRASGTAIRAAIRDCGAFMDPRSRKDWWRGR